MKICGSVIWSDNPNPDEIAIIYSHVLSPFWNHSSAKFDVNIHLHSNIVLNKTPWRWVHVFFFPIFEWWPWFISDNLCTVTARVLCPLRRRCCWISQLSRSLPGDAAHSMVWSVKGRKKRKNIMKRKKEKKEKKEKNEKKDRKERKEQKERKTRKTRNKNKSRRKDRKTSWMKPWMKS